VAKAARLRVMLVDDHALVAEGFRALLEPEFEIVAIVSDPNTVVDAYARLRPHVVALDIAMPGKSGLEVAREILARWPRARILMLTMHGQHGYVEQALRVGASGFVLKLADVDELRLAIRTVAAGQSYVSALTPAAAGQRPSPLTTRQIQVLRLFAEGLTAAEVAARLNIEPRTAHHHRAAIKRMLGLHTNAALVRYAISEGLIE